MAAESRGRRELLALIHQHLLRTGYARAARELQAQLGQKLLPSLATSLEEIFTHWEKTPSKARRRKLSDEEAAIPEKIRVPDPVSSSESSEKEEDEKEKTKTGNVTSISPVKNSAVNVESSEDDDSSSEEETPSGKGAITVTPAVVSGKAANSLHSPVKPTAPGSKVAASSAANRTVLSNKQQPSASVGTPAKAGQKLPGPGKPGRAVAAVSQAVQSKAPVTTKAPESCSSSSSSESEEEKETPTVKASAPKVELKQAAGEAESSSEESSDETSSEEELATTAVQAQPAVKAVQVNSTPVKSAPATSVSTKKSSTVKQKAVTPNQTEHGSETAPVAAKPDDTSESSDSSDSGNEEPPSVTQSKPSLKTSQAILSPVKTTPAASLSSKAAPAKTLPLSQGKQAPKTAALKQAKATPGRTAAPAKPAESTNPAESTDSSGSEEEDLPVPVSQKRLPEQPGSVPSLSQAAKATTPQKAVGSTLKNESSESGSSDSSDSEEETPVSQIQPALPAVKSNATPQPTSAKKAPAPTPAPAPAPVLRMASSDDSSEESDSDEEIVPPTQTLSQQNIKPTKVSSTVAAKANATPPSGKGIKAPPIPSISRVSESSNSDSSESSTVVGEAVPPPCLKQTTPTGKAPPASPAAPQAASILRSPTAKLKKPGLQPAQDARLSQTALLTQAEDSLDSSSSSDSDEETPKQPPKSAGLLQKPGGTEPDDSSSSDSSEDEEAVSQSLLTGYVSLSKSPAAPQTPKTVPPQPVGNAGQGKAAVNANSSLAKVSTKAAPADSSSSDSSDSDTDVEQVSANHKAESKPPLGQEATGASNKEKGAGKTDASHANPKHSPFKKALAAKENDVEAKETQANPLPSALLSTPQPEESSLGSKSEVTTAAGVPAVQTPEGLEKKKKKKEKKEKKEKKKTSSTADKAVKTSKGKDKENKKQKASQKRKRPGEDGAVGQPKEKKRKGQANEEVPKKKKKKAADDPEKPPDSKEKKKSSKKKKTGKEKKNKKMPTEGESAADSFAEVHKKKKKKKKTAEPEGLL